MREFKTLTVHLNQLEQDYQYFGLSYFYEYKFPNGSSEWSKDDIFGPNKAHQEEFYKDRFDLKKFDLI